MFFFFFLLLCLCVCLFTNKYKIIVKLVMLWLFFFGLTTENNFFFHSRLLFSFYWFFLFIDNKPIWSNHFILLYSILLICQYYWRFDWLVLVFFLLLYRTMFVVGDIFLAFIHSFIHSWLIRFWNCHICVKAKAELLFFVVVVVISLVRWYMRKKNLPQAIVVNIKIEEKKMWNSHWFRYLHVCVCVCVTHFILVVSWSYAMIMMRNS